MSMLHHGIASLTQKFVTHICFDDEILTLPQIFFLVNRFVYPVILCIQVKLQHQQLPTKVIIPIQIY